MTAREKLVFCCFCALCVQQSDQLRGEVAARVSEDILENVASLVEIPDGDI